MGKHSVPTALAAAVVALTLSACSNGGSGSPAKTGQPSDAGDSGSSADASADGADGGMRPDGSPASGADGGGDATTVCSQGCTNTAPSGAMCAVSADAQLIDTTGAPVAGQTVLLCGTNLCSLPVTTDAQGVVHFSLCLNMTSPALKFLGGTSYASFAIEMTEPTETFPPITLFPLPAQGVGFPDGGGTVASAGVSLTVAAGAVKFDPSQPGDPNSLEFRAVAMDPTKAPPGLDASVGIKALWGLAPVNATLSPKGALTIPNPDPTDWTPGTQVDFVVDSLDENPNPTVPYGTWGAVGTGTVSADGQTITTNADAGGGLPLTGIVGVGPHL